MAELPQSEYAILLFKKYLQIQRAQKAQKLGTKGEGYITLSKHFANEETGLKESYFSKRSTYAERRVQDIIPFNDKLEQDCKKLYGIFEQELAKGNFFFEEVAGTKYLLRRVEKKKNKQTQKVRPFHKLPEEEIINRMITAPDGPIKILDTRLPDLFYYQKSSQDVSSKWLTQSNRHFEFLLLNPVSKLFELRLKADLPGSKFLELIEDAIKRLEFIINLQATFPERISVRVFEERSTFNIFQLPDVTYTGWYSTRGSSHDMTFVRLSASTTFEHELRQHFSAIWGRAVEGRAIIASIKSAFRTEKRYFEDLKDKKIKIYLPMGRFDLSNEQDLLTAEAQVQGQKEFVVFTASFTAEHRSPRETYWELHHGDSIKGDFNPMREEYFRCQLNHNEFTLNIVVPQNILKSREPVWIIYSVIRKNESFCGTTVAINTQLTQQPLSDKDQGQLIKDKIIGQNFNFWNPVSIIQNLPNHLTSLRKFVGTYKVYAYGRHRGNDVMVLANSLRIDNYGKVTFRRYKDKDHATGHFNYDGHNLFIELNITDDEDDNNKRNYFSFFINNKFPKNGSVYGGIFLSQSKNHNYPHGRRVILEFQGDKSLDQIEPERNVINTPAYEQLDMGLKKALTGRVENFIGFPREANAIYDYTGLLNEASKNKERCDFADVFYKAAWYEAQHGHYQRAAVNIRRAYNHGFTEFERFERELQTIGTEAYNRVTKEKEYKNVKEALDAQLN